MRQVFSIAIDGPSGAGKSTMARALAEALGAMYLDTGAMYRALGLFMLRRGAPDDPAACIEALKDAKIDVRFLDGAQHIFLNGEDVSRAIREPEISLAASAVSSVAEVRRHMVSLQRDIARGHSVVMDGRDIGTRVLPEATLKVYLDASAEVRARRRCAELAEKGLAEPYEKVLEEMRRRDYQDTHRAASPLQMAEGAVYLDSSDLSPEQTLSELKRLAEAAIGREEAP